jgi:hypothetical protein
MAGLPSEELLRVVDGRSAAAGWDTWQGIPELTSQNEERAQAREIRARFATEPTSQMGYHRVRAAIARDLPGVASYAGPGDDETDQTGTPAVPRTSGPSGTRWPAGRPDALSPTASSRRRRTIRRAGSRRRPIFLGARRPSGTISGTGRPRGRTRMRFPCLSPTRQLASG